MRNCIICHLSNREYVFTFILNFQFCFGLFFLLVYVINKRINEFMICSFISFTLHPLLFCQTKIYCFFITVKWSYFITLFLICWNFSNFDSFTIDLKFDTFASFFVVLSTKCSVFLRITSNHRSRLLFFLFLRNLFLFCIRTHISFSQFISDFLDNRSSGCSNTGVLLLNLLDSWFNFVFNFTHSVFHIFIVQLDLPKLVLRVQHIDRFWHVIVMV